MARAAMTASRTATPEEQPAPGELYARIVVSVPVDQWFHYRVPAPLRGTLRRGDRVRVRFHGRSVVGTVLQLDATAEVPEVLEIQERLGDEHHIAPDILGLCTWVAEHSGASLGETLDATLLGGFGLILAGVVLVNLADRRSKTITAAATTPAD